MLTGILFRQNIYKLERFNTFAQYPSNACATVRHMSSLDCMLWEISLVIHISFYKIHEQN